MKHSAMEHCRPAAQQSPPFFHLSLGSSPKVVMAKRNSRLSTDSPNSSGDSEVWEKTRTRPFKHDGFRETSPERSHTDFVTRHLLITLRASVFHYLTGIHDIAQTHKLEKYKQIYIFPGIYHDHLTIQPRAQAILQYRSVPNSRNQSFSCPLPG